MCLEAFGFEKTDHFCLYMKVTLMHYPIVRLWIARFALTDDFLPMPSSGSALWIVLVSVTY